MKLENGFNLTPLQLQQKSTGAAWYSSYPPPPPRVFFIGGHFGGKWWTISKISSFTGRSSLKILPNCRGILLDLYTWCIDYIISLAWFVGQTDTRICKLVIPLTETTNPILINHAWSSVSQIDSQDSISKYKITAYLRYSNITCNNLTNTLTYKWSTNLN